jgi:cob(I)alamin adenosyltransferase
MVNLTRIYTRTGDDGTTALGDFSRTPKTDPRLAAYADTNEANACLGVAVAAGGLREDLRTTLVRIQNELFDVGADLCLPLRETYDYPPLRVQQPWIDDLEADCDRYLAELQPLRSFILPEGRRVRHTYTSPRPWCAGPSERRGRPSSTTEPIWGSSAARAASTP